MVKVGEPEQIKPDLVKMSTIIADATGFIKLAVWNYQIDSIKTDVCYKFQNVTVRMFDNELYLTTNIYTKFEEIDDLTDVIPTEQVTLPEETVQQIETVEVTKQKTCSFCTIPIQYNESIPTVKYTNCNKKGLISKLPLSVITKVTINYKQYNVPENVMNKFMPDYKTKTPDEIEDLLLLNAEAKIHGNFWLVGWFWV